MPEKFPSLSSFLSSARSVERRTLETAIDSSTEHEVQRILSESSVRLSVYNQASSVSEQAQTGEAPNKSTAEIIQEGICESVAMNAARVKSILDDLFSSIDVNKEREAMWINKLCKLFNIDDSLSLEEKSALIEKQLAEDDDTLNYVTYLIETGEKKMHG